MDDDSFGLLIIIAIVLFLLGGSMGSNGTHTENEIVKHQCGHYNPQTGEFAWNK